MWDVTDILAAGADVAQAGVKGAASVANNAAEFVAKGVDKVAGTNAAESIEEFGKKIDDVDLVDSKLDDMGISKKLDSAAEVLVPGTAALKVISLMNRSGMFAKATGPVKKLASQLLDKAKGGKKVKDSDIDTLMKKVGYSPEEIARRKKQGPGGNIAEKGQGTTENYQAPALPKKKRK